MEATVSEQAVRKPTKGTFSSPKGENGLAKVEATQWKLPDNAALKARSAAADAQRLNKVVPAGAMPTEPSPAEKAKRVKKEKIVRNSFAMPKSDYAKIAVLKQRCLDAGVSTKRSKLLRAGLLLLESLPAKHLLAAVSSVGTVKAVRPGKS
jgi:hypothetical protein